MRSTGIFRISFSADGGFLVMMLFLGACLAHLMGCSGGKPDTGADDQALAKLISHYFSSWSKPDMPAFQGCFHDKASVYFIDSSGNPRHYLLGEFIASQEQAHREARAPMSERPTKSTITVHGRTAQAVVRWELTKGDARVTGTDYFTFLKTGKEWKILSLVFEQDKQM